MAMRRVSVHRRDSITITLDRNVHYSIVVYCLRVCGVISHMFILFVSGALQVGLGFWE